MGRAVTEIMAENAPPGGLTPVTDGLPVMSGRVSLVRGVAEGGPRRTPLLLKVYRPAFGCSYGVLTPDKGNVIKDSGAISLRKCSVHAVPADQTSPTERHFRIVSEDREGASLTFSVPSEQELSRWVQELTILTSSSTSDRMRLPLRTLGSSVDPCRLCRDMHDDAARRRPPCQPCWRRTKPGDRFQTGSVV